jgi:two-component system CheB/CheR fusion protein
MADEDLLTQLVVVGASAGGVDALSALVTTLPKDFPAPMVIAQHLDPQRPSHLGDILARRTTLPIHTLNGHETLIPGHIYVAPANQHVEISNQHISLHTNGAGRPKPSVNLLLSSAAQSYGDGLIAVILTGTGSDGAAGALEVKKAGGTVIIQNPATASYPSMPRSLAPTSIDFVANIDEIGALLYDLLTGVKDLAQKSETKSLQSLLQHLHERSGLDFTTYKMPTIQRRLQRRMVATGTSSLAAYRRYLQHHPEEYNHLISSFLIKVTEFFRDRDLFAALREQVLPELIAAARRHGNELRLWSAGCATGEEAYSLAILVADLLGDELDRFTVRIFATDLDNDAIAFARRGVYPPTALTALPHDIITRFFHRTDGDYEVQKRVRSLVIFGQHDLGQRAPFPRIDLILCRNVLIYFSMEMQKRVLQLFAYSLRDGGHLVLGKAETTSPLAVFFLTEQPILKIYRRQGERLLMPMGQIKHAAPLRMAPVRPPGNGSAALLARGPAHVRTPPDKWGSLMYNLPIGVVVVDRRYDIQIINAAAQTLMDIHRSAIGEDLLHLAEHIPTRPLRAIIDAVLRGEPAPIEGDVVPVETETSAPRLLHIVGYPQQFEGDNGPISSALLVVNDVTAEVQEQQRQAQLQSHPLPPPTAPLPHEPHELEEVVLRQQDEIGHLTAQVQRLMTSNRELRDANQGLTAINVELHQANEEYLVNTEEVQAAAEEVETLNEELQATNEELETLNEELQATVEELNTTNDDLEARSREMQELAHAREEQQRVTDAERARLEAILVSMADAVLVVDGHAHSLLTNAAAEQMFGQMFGEGATSVALEDEQGRPISATHALRQRAARGEAFRMTFTLPGQDGTRRWFEANAHPIQSDGQTRGGVVVIRDITDRSLRRIQDEFMALASHELLTPLTAAQMAVQLLVRRLPPSNGPDDPTTRQSEIALHQMQRIITLVNDLMDSGRLQSGKLQMMMQRTSLRDLVRQTVAAAQLTTAVHQIAFTPPAEDLWVPCDPVRIEQILFNLLTNAIRHTPDGTRIDVRLRRANDAAELVVQDYGTGIAADRLAHIFTRFYQVAQSDKQPHHGLGLGLYITRELVQAHGGEITVASQEGVGTTFTITLPLRDAPTKEAGG